MNPWSVYLIYNGNRTYVGSTTNVVRRLRQHNGEIVGGARSTRAYAGSWYLVTAVTGFSDRSSACRWEKIVKSRARGLGPRQEALQGLLAGICPKGSRYYEVPSGLSLVLNSTD